MALASFIFSMPSISIPKVVFDGLIVYLLQVGQRLPVILRIDMLFYLLGKLMRFMSTFGVVSRIFLATTCAVVSAQSGGGPSTGPDTLNNEARGQVWWAHVRFLADDSMRGRMTGSDEYLKAAAYVVEQFKSWGLKPAGVNGTYYQPVRFDVLITDCHMPEIDGIELTRLIRAAEAKRGTSRMSIGSPRVCVRTISSRRPSWPSKARSTRS